VTSISDFFLRAKHWQLFLLFIPGAAGVFINGNRVILSVLAFVSTFLYGSWLWFAASFFNTITKKSLRLRLTFFQLTLACLLLYLLVAIPIFQREVALPNALVGLSAALFLPLHFVAIFAVLYIFYFVSKSLVLAEAGGPVRFSAYVGPLLLFWFFPLGVWLLQPRINRLHLANASQSRTNAMLKSQA
jgi:hypothetical protein